MSQRTVLRGEILHFTDDPLKAGTDGYEYLEDGALVIEDGLVAKLGQAKQVLASLPMRTEVHEYKDSLILPGFIDTHVHYPQIEMIASYGEQLLGWLETYAFPTEAQYHNKAHAETVSRFFLDQLISHGTTTALVFGTVHPESVDAFFEAALERNLRMICGKVLMDRNAPDYLMDTAESGYEDSRALIERWHGKGRLQYAVTPRFAPTCSDDQLHKAAALLDEFPDVYLHTHLSENNDELAWIKDLYPHSPHYLGTYDRFKLVRQRSVFAHGVHLSDDEFKLLATKQGAIAHCPTSNLFLGSGLFDLEQAQDRGVKVGLGTDVGGGTSLSLLQTMNEAYKIQQLRGCSLQPLSAFYLATLGGARVLDLEGVVGNFLPGNEADLIVLDYKATPLLDFRMQRCKSLSERLFVLSMLGDDRAVAQTWVMGKCWRSQ